MQFSARSSNGNQRWSFVPCCPDELSTRSPHNLIRLRLPKKNDDYYDKAVPWSRFHWRLSAEQRYPYVSRNSNEELYCFFCCTAGAGITIHSTTTTIIDHRGPLLWLEHADLVPDQQKLSDARQTTHRRAAQTRNHDSRRTNPTNTPTTSML